MHFCRAYAFFCSSLGLWLWWLLLVWLWWSSHKGDEAAAPRTPRGEGAGQDTDCPTLSRLTEVLQLEHQPCWPTQGKQNPSDFQNTNSWMQMTLQNLKKKKKNHNQTNYSCVILSPFWCCPPAAAAPDQVPCTGSEQERQPGGVSGMPHLGENGEIPTRDGQPLGPKNGFCLQTHPKRQPLVPFVGHPLFLVTKFFSTFCVREMSVQLRSEPERWCLLVCSCIFFLTGQMSHPQWFSWE